MATLLVANPEGEPRRYDDVQTWLDWLNDPRLPAGTLVAWPLLGALWAGAATIGNATALLAAACVVIITRLADTRWLRPLVPVSIAIGAGVILANEAWGVGMLVLVVLPLAASALTTLADRKLPTPTS